MADSAAIWVNSQTRQAQIAGSPAQVRAWRKIVAGLDAPATETASTRLVATQPNAYAKVQQVIKATRHVWPDCSSLPTERPANID